MKYLIILAHPDKGSFNSYIAKAVCDQGSDKDWNMILHDLYREDFDPVLSLEDTMQLPKELIKKIFQKLARAGFITAVKGTGGGYLLDMSLENITIGDLRRALTGERFIVKCLEDKSSCSRIDICRIHDGMGRFQEMWNKFLDSVSIKELAKGG